MYNKDVSILMPTYNHERFIAQAIESALLQQTQYSFELLINDDASTDATAKIASEYAEKYPDKIKFFHQKQNQGLLKNYKFLFEQAQGKYIAVLESDDIWISQNKLEKQISFMEQNPEYALTATDYNTIDESNTVLTEWHKDFDKTLNGCWYETLLLKDHLAALTLVFTRESFDKSCNIDEYIKHNFKTLDYPVILAISANYKCHYFHETTSAYRILGSSISNSADYKKCIAFEDSVTNIQRYIIEKYGRGSLAQIEIDNAIAWRYLSKALKYSKPFDFVKYARILHGKTKKDKIIHFFPFLWYLQHKIRFRHSTT